MLENPFLRPWKNHAFGTDSNGDGSTFIFIEALPDKCFVFCTTTVFKAHYDSIRLPACHGCMHEHLRCKPEIQSLGNPNCFARFFGFRRGGLRRALSKRLHVWGTVHATHLVGCCSLYTSYAADQKRGGNIGRGRNVKNKN